MEGITCSEILRGNQNIGIKPSFQKLNVTLTTSFTSTIATMPTIPLTKIRAGASKMKEIILLQ
jgi:hypothetical protein